MSRFEERIHELLAEAGYKLEKIVYSGHEDCLCVNENCNIVRGHHVIIARTTDGRYAALRYYSHTQTDCDAANIPLEECDIDEMDAESLTLIGVYDTFNDAVRVICGQ